MAKISMFTNRGVHCVVDGQFGSTGKGALSAYLADRLISSGKDINFSGCIYSGGPNSGHTSYFEGKKIVLKQLPTFSIHTFLRNVITPIYLSAGAVIDREVLKKEAAEYERISIFVHPNAAIVTDEDRKAEETGSIAEVAGTRSGTGAALIRKIQRQPNAIARKSLGEIGPNVVIQEHRLKPEKYAYMMEVSQGFSLGINSHFYPKVTSRECTVMQGLADARLPPRSSSRTYMAIRTFPIRVGNVDGFSSGDWYSDQRELNWDRFSVEPERTTVTNRVRRIATFSMDQFYAAVQANDPDWVFISHMDYLNDREQRGLIEEIQSAKLHMNKHFGFLYGSGPNISDIQTEEEYRASKLNHSNS